MPTATVQQAFALALQRHQAGRLGEAEALYRQILAVQPGHAEALHHLGLLAQQAGRRDLAIDLIRQALALNPDHAAAHFNLGAVLADQGRFDEAISQFRRALELEPGAVEAHLNLGAALAAQGQLEEAIIHYRRVLALQPDFVTAHYNLANTLRDRDQLEEAVAAYRRALQLNPDYAMAHNNLGNALRNLDQLDESIAAHHRALEIRPDYVEAHNNLGIALADRGQFEEAIAAYRRALELKPDYADAHNTLGNALKDQGRLDDAVNAYRRAIQFTPEHTGAHSNLAYTLHFHSSQDDRTINEVHQCWHEQFAEPLRKLHRPHANDCNPDRRLRIGYVSPNFYRHVICHFLTPLLEAHDKARVEIYCYASVRRPDAFTERVKRSADVWCEVAGLGDQDLAERIRADQIDILVDLTQHMADHRLLMFARKPAPVQVAWLGYPASTGLPAVDYRFTDRFMEPEGSAWSESVETPVHLPDSWFCFDPIESPEVAALPTREAGHITFGSLNNFCKVNEAVLQLWVAVLQAVEGSRLLLHCPAGAAQTRLRQWFEARGIAADRLELVSRTATRAEYLELFQRIDVGLDPFPYNGGTTTCEALWMGVPVVSLAGRTAVSRLGLSVLTNAGLPELLAFSEEDYVRIAAQLAKDLPRLAELRATLRSRMLASPLMAAARFARNMETAFRSMWQRWCARKTLSIDTRLA